MRWVWSRSTFGHLSPGISVHPLATHAPVDRGTRAPRTVPDSEGAHGMNRSTVRAGSFRRSVAALGVMSLVAFSALLIVAGPAMAGRFTGGRQQP